MYLGHLLTFTSNNCDHDPMKISKERGKTFSVEVKWRSSSKGGKSNGTVKWEDLILVFVANIEYSVERLKHALSPWLK